MYLSWHKRLSNRRYYSLRAQLVLRALGQLRLASAGFVSFHAQTGWAGSQAMTEAVQRKATRSWMDLFLAIANPFITVRSNISLRG